MKHTKDKYKELAIMGVKLESHSLTISKVGSDLKIILELICIKLIMVYTI